MLWVLVVLALAPIASAEVVDRIAIIAGRQVITELQVDEELRVTAFLNKQPIERDPKRRRDAAARLVEQLLIEQEVQVSRYPLPDGEDVAKYVVQIRQSVGPASNFNDALVKYGLTEDMLRDHLALQLTTLRFIEFRFQPEVDISDAEIESAYERETANWRAHHSGLPPTIEASRDALRKALLEERVDEELDAWLQQRRKRISIVYRDASLE